MIDFAFQAMTTERIMLDGDERLMIDPEMTLAHAAQVLRCTPGPRAFQDCFHRIRPASDARRFAHRRFGDAARPGPDRPEPSVRGGRAGVRLASA